MHGDSWNFGWPDLFATHRRVGPRWIEVKLPEMKGSRFTGAQFDTFPMFIANGAGIWILTGADDTNYQLLFRPPNAMQYILDKL